MAISPSYDIVLIIRRLTVFHWSAILDLDFIEDPHFYVICRVINNRLKKYLKKRKRLIIYGAVCPKVFCCNIANANS